jgi:predicted secreted hydrolase
MKPIVKRSAKRFTLAHKTHRWRCFTVKWRVILIGVVIIAVSLFGFSLIDVSTSADIGADAVISAPDLNLDDYARAIEPYDWQFPADFGAHDDFLTEWWYYTGNLKTEEGRHFGFQFTIFRRAITPPEQTTISDTNDTSEPSVDTSEWRSNQIYMAHFTLSDIDGGEFVHAERYSRAGADLAGATVDPRYRVWLEDWVIEAQDDDAQFVRIDAEDEDFALNITLEQIKPPALQGQAGLSPKSAEVGNASYYYTLSRLLTEGTIRLGEETFDVTGLTWKDHEFSTSALGNGAQGWDWFGLIFDDNTELMVGKIRLQDGGREPAFGGLYIREDGTTVYLPSESFSIEAQDAWTSPHTGATYPLDWVITINHEDVQLTINATPLMLDQELHGANVEYWEGAVRISGDKTGYGYAELTGYVDTMQGRF